MDNTKQSTKSLTGSQRRQQRRDWEATQAQARRDDPAKVVPKGLVAQRQQQLAGFIKTKRQEQRALGRWNPNAAGRNQGLVHILDYAYAPPPRTQNKNLSTALANRSYLGKTLIEQAKVDHKTLGGADLVPGSLTKQGQVAKKLSSSLEGQMSKLLEGLQGKDIGDRKKKDDYKKLDSLKKTADARVLEQTFFTLAQDTSKGGRIKLIEESAGAATGSFKRAKSEIRSVTKELGRLQAITAPGTVTGPSNQPKTLTGWYKSKKETGKRSSKWKTGERSITDTSVSTERRTNSHNRALKIVNWGPTAQTQRHSTVMGA